MIRKAEEFRKITNAVKEDFVAKFIKETIIPLIEKAAANGQDCIFFDFSKNNMYVPITNMLKEHGYKISGREDDSECISW